MHTPQGDKSESSPMDESSAGEIAGAGAAVLLLHIAAETNAQLRSPLRDVTLSLTIPEGGGSACDAIEPNGACYPLSLILYFILLYIYTHICKQINRSRARAHTHTPTKNNTPDTDTHTHPTRTTFQAPKRTPPTNT